MKVDWDKVWQKYSIWYFTNNVNIHDAKLWQAKIQSLVEAQLKPKRKKP